MDSRKTLLSVFCFLITVVVLCSCNRSPRVSVAIPPDVFPVLVVDSTHRIIMTFEGRFCDSTVTVQFNPMHLSSIAGWGMLYEYPRKDTVWATVRDGQVEEVSVVNRTWVHSSYTW